MDYSERPKIYATPTNMHRLFLAFSEAEKTEEAEEKGKKRRRSEFLKKSMQTFCYSGNTKLKLCPVLQSY